MTQDKLRQEVQNQRLTETSIGQMKYLSACIKETLRKIPIAGGIARVIPSDLVVGGYRVPAETVLITDLQVSGHDSRHFTDPNEYVLHSQWKKSMLVPLLTATDYVMLFQIQAREVAAR